ncbi:MAG: helix-turn-helix transcriptional regulator [Clostridia bacterium]|nr:helix-turn-helix transcriptional regulator [Clostridia bacterium]
MRNDKIAIFIRENRKAAGLTQEEFAVCSGLGLRFVRELEQGKVTVRLDDHVWDGSRARQKG